MKLPIAVTLSILLLAGCNSIPSDQSLAQTGQWSDLGERDGRFGIKERQTSSLNKLGNVSDSSIEAYKAGYQKGSSYHEFQRQLNDLSE